MSSYVLLNESRGVGAIAAEDGETDVLPGDKNNWEPTRRFNLPARVVPRGTLIARRKRGATPHKFVPGLQAELLRQPTKRLVLQPKIPAVTHGPVVTGPVTVPAPPLVVTSHPPVTSEAGWYTDPYPADAMTAGVRPVAPAPAPTPGPVPKKNRTLIIAGAIGAAALLWYVTR